MMPASEEEIAHYYRELLQAVRVRDDLLREYGGALADEHKRGRYETKRAEVEQRIRSLKGLIDAVDLPPMQVNGPTIPGVPAP